MSKPLRAEDLSADAILNLACRVKSAAEWKAALRGPVGEDHGQWSETLWEAFAEIGWREGFSYMSVGSSDAYIEAHGLPILRRIAKGRKG